MEIRKIPNEIKLFNQTVKVILKSDLIDKHEAFGMWDYKTNKIYLQKSTRKYKLTNEQISSTLIHEICHAILDLMGESKLSENEKFISSLSNLIHQFIVQI